MIWLPTCDQLMRLHTKVSARTGGSDALRDHGLVESALARADSGFAGSELYPTVSEKAGAVCAGLISNHGFMDGNKRIGVMAMLLILRKNGVQLRYTQQELIALGMDAAKGALRTPEIIQWIRTHMEETP